MKKRTLFLLILILALLLSFASGAQAENTLFFVAVNDTIPVTLTAQPVTSGGILYVPYTVFDARPGNVVSAYNQTAQTFVLFTKDSRIVFDLTTDEVTDENQNSSTQSTLFRNNLLYVPLVFCASHFGLKVSMLESKDGYPVLRFTTGSEVYDDSLFIEKAENLIAFRVSQQETNNPDTVQPGQNNPQEQPTPQPSEEEKAPSMIYLGFINAQTMADSAQALADYNLRGTFFLTEDEIRQNPSLVRDLYAAGHVIGLRVPDGANDPAAALDSANDALDEVLNLRVLLALLPAGADTSSIGHYHYFSENSAALSVEAAVEHPEIPHFLLCSGGATQLLSSLYAANANIRILRETVSFF